MTRDEQRKIKQDKQATKIAEREEKKQDKKDIKAWAKMVKVAKSKGAWIEETDTHFLIYNPIS